MNRRTAFSRSPVRTATLVTSTLLFLSLLAFIPNASARMQEPKEFDRLDGKGATSRKVDVIEWENNLEIHVYPKGSLKSLGMKVDRTDKKNPIMVIEYAFNHVAYTLIRRAKLSLDLKDGFKAFEETSAEGYDKIMISNNTLTSGVKPYPLGPAPTQLYPDYHPSLKGEAPEERNLAQTPETPVTQSAPDSGLKFHSFGESAAPSEGTFRKRIKIPANDNGEGGVRSFAF